MSSSRIGNDSLIARAVDCVFGYDFFISYSHGDGSNLPLRLKERLAQAGFRVFVDQTEYVAGLDLRRETRRQVAKSRKIVVVARPSALRSEWVKREVDVAIAHAKIPIILNVNGAIEAAAESSAIAIMAREQQWILLNAALGDPDSDLSDATVGELVRGFNYTRQETKRQRIFALAAGVLALTTGIAVWQAVEATEARIVAETQRDRAQRVLEQIIATANRRVHALSTRLRNDRSAETKAVTLSQVSKKLPAPTERPLDQANQLIVQGSKLLESENFEPARKSLELALDVLSPRSDKLTKDPAWRLALLKVYDRLAVTHMKAGDPTSATSLIKRGLDVASKASNDLLPTTEWLRAAATLHQDFGDLLLNQRRFQDAEKQFRLVLDIRRDIARDLPDFVIAQRELAIAHTHLGDLFLAKSDAKDAVQVYMLSLSIVEPLALRHLADSELQGDLSAIYQRVADALIAERKFEDALVWINKDVAISERLAAAQREPRLQRDLASSYDRRARTYESLDRNAEALEQYGKGLSLLGRIIGKGEIPSSWQRDTAAMLESVGKLLAKKEQPEQAVLAFRRALAIREGLAASFEEPSWQQEVEASYRRTSEIMLEMGRPGEALETAEQYLLAVSLVADSDEARAERISRALGTLCWSALNARSFARAVWAGDVATKLAPRLDWVRLNYAHALMLSGDREAAKTIYIAGPGLEPKNADAWKASIRKDFDTLRQRRIEDSLMQEISERLGP